ncbi:cation-translocating P-type ATPase [Rhizobium sp. CSW-27]|uniref:cation-translocating P-type ATPase n=1 Tax=Rhizobium sp. CSW-27 TaxID=2839985 RepID=UPI001C020AF0|nr:cation-translocating P-type ATPase [Rhizobium sp. CSW-27]MBT9371601.1 cadmium-translocating P-type ATPase [Rhizobium sp. CSW-27]
MSCCAPGTEGALELDGAVHALPSREELLLSARDLGDGRRQTDLSVPGVHCGACITAVERALRGVEGVEKARVNLSTKRVSIVWRAEGDGRGADPVRFAEVIRRATGYESHLFGEDIEASDRLRADLIRGVAVTGFAAANIMLLSVSVWSGADASTRDLFHWISAMIAAPALVYGGRFFYRSAWSVLKRGRTNMDVPIALAITLSYAVSLWETLHHGAHAWFDATASLLFFLLIGRTLDHVMRDRARSAITGLARLAPRGALVVQPDGSRDYRPVSEVVPGDRIAIAAGDRIPVDGIVSSGESDLDVSIATGESVPVAVRPGVAVQAGTVSLTGSLIVTATATARQSFLAEIIALMEAAEGGRAQYRRIADRAASIYAPAVHLLAILTFLGWGLFGGDWKQALLIAIAVLIITCPCALGLAVPVVQVVAAGRLFQHGIMVRDGSAMERLAEIDTVIFDKTGTLTLGRPRLIEARGKPLSRAMAAALAAHSRHPLSRAIHAAHAGPVPLVETVRELPGQGLLAEMPEGIYRLGSRAFACPQTAAQADSGASEVVLSLNGEELARFLLEDTPRPGAEEAIAALKAEGLGTLMLSGDRQTTVAAMAEQLDLDGWQAELSPQGKVEACNGLAAAGHRALMVGDGINDAPALSAAHVSMAPATAADIGRQAADIVFLHDGLDAVPTALAISRRAGRLIRENFGLAIGYNMIAVPFAIAGYATPLMASVAMSTSSLIVIANALRLNRFRRPAATSGREGQAPTGPVTREARLA